MEYLFDFIPNKSYFNLTLFTSLPFDTPKKTSLERLAKKQIIAQKGIERFVRLAIMGEVMINGEVVLVERFCKSFIENKKLYLTHMVNGREAVLEVSPTIKSFYKFYINIRGR